MGDTTAIAWTEATWNPWYGCTKVSPGCAHCYMFREQIRYGRDPEVVTRSKTKFNDPLKWKEGKLIFTCSWSDWFHEAADAWRDEAWDVIRRTPQHTYQILTKRPERISSTTLPHDWGDGYANVWLGTSVENQRHAFRAGILNTVPAVVRFVSAEPLLGAVDLLPFLSSMRRPSQASSGVDWVIVGGESGPGARSMEIEWARALRDQCVQADAAFFLKQLGGNPDARAHGKAILDGRTHTEMPGR